MSSVTINGFRFALNGEVADNALGLWCNDVKGWNDYSASVQSDARPGAPGSFADDTAFAAAVTPTFSGICSMPTGFEAARMKAKLKSIINKGQEVTVVYDDNGWVTQRKLFVANVSMPHNAGKPGFSWAIDLWGSDPYMYGAEVNDWTELPLSGTGQQFPETYPVDFGTPTNDGRLVARNTGFAPTFSRYTVTGGFDSAGFTIIRLKTGERITLRRAVPTGSIVYIDPRSGRVSMDGTDNDISAFLTQYDWWEVDPESEETLQFVANGTSSGKPRLTAYTRPAFY